MLFAIISINTSGGQKELLTLSLKAENIGNTVCTVSNVSDASGIFDLRLSNPKGGNKCLIELERASKPNGTKG